MLLFSLGWIECEHIRRLPCVVYMFRVGVMRLRQHLFFCEKIKIFSDTIEGGVLSQ
jgi:hypothetical protein